MLLIVAHHERKSRSDQSIPLANAITIAIAHARPKTIPSQTSPLHSSKTILAMALQPPRQLDASEVRHADGRARQSADHAVDQCAESQVAADARPAAGQLRVGIPPHAELQRQGITNHNPRRWLSRNTVRSRRRNRARSLRFGRRVHQHVHARGDVQVAQLQRTRQRDHHGRINIAQTALAVRLFRRALLELILQSAGREGLGGYAAGERRVVVDVELEQVEERVVDEVDRAVDLLLHAEEELQRPAGLVACREGDVGELACGVGDVLARVTDRFVNASSFSSIVSGVIGKTYIVRFKQLTGIFSPTWYPCWINGSWAAFAAASEV